MLALRGIYVPLITPFTAGGQVAEDALADLGQAALDAGAAGLVALGTTAEAATLDADERRTVVAVCADVCGQRGAPLVVGAGSADTRATRAALAALGGLPQVDAALVPVPPYTRPGEAGVLAHFAELVATSPVPLIVYHIPYRTGQQLSAGCLRALSRLPGVIGVKYAAGCVDASTVDLLGDLPPDFAVLAGDDVFLAPLLALGARGGILAAAHLATDRFVEFTDAWREGDPVRARQLGHALARWSAAAFAEPNPTVLKGVLHALGRIPTPDVRLPLLPAGPASVGEALARLVELSGSGTGGDTDSGADRTAGHTADLLVSP